MKKRNEWWLKGRYIARHLAALEGFGPYTWRRVLFGAYVPVTKEGEVIHPPLRFCGNSKQRRQQRRALLRYLNGS